DSLDYPFVIEDTRKERGDYDDFFRIAKPPHDGTLTERIARLEHDIREYQRLLAVLMRALIDKGVLTKEQIERPRAFLAGRGAWNGARIVARAWSIRSSSRPCSRGGARRCANSTFRPASSASSASPRTRRGCTTSWCARSAHATRTTSWAIRRGGTATTATRSASSVTPAACWRIGLTCGCPTASRCASTTAPATCAGWCCRVGPQAPRAGARRNWRDW